MGKKLSSWNLFVKKIYAEGKAKNANFAFKDALKEASKRKGEMKKGDTSKSHEMGEGDAEGMRKSKKRGTKKRKTRKSKKKGTRKM